MLAIVSQNPIAFLGQNVNGLESGYLLLLPENAESMLDPITAIAEVARHNMEWQRGLAINDSGLRLVTDMELTGEVPMQQNQALKAIRRMGVAADQQIGISAMLPPSLEVRRSGGNNLSKATIIDLETSLAGVRSELAGQGCRKAARELSQRQPSLSLHRTVQSEGKVKFKVVEMIGPFWPWIWAVGAFLAGVVCYQLDNNERPRGG